MDRSQKEKLIKDLNALFGSVSMVVVARPVGLTVAEATDLRRQARAAGAGYKVAKNSLTRLALKGTPFEVLQELFTGPTAIAYSRDPIAAARVIVEYSEKNQKLAVLGGALDARLLDASAVKMLAKLPSLDQLRGTLVGLIQTPATRIAGVLQAPAGQLARLLNSYAEKNKAA